MLRFHLSGMSCAHCEKAIRAAIREVDASAEVSIDLSAQTVTLSKESVAPATLQAAIEEAGYEVKSVTAP